MGILDSGIARCGCVAGVACGCGFRRCHAIIGVTCATIIVIATHRSITTTAISRINGIIAIVAICPGRRTCIGVIVAAINFIGASGVGYSVGAIIAVGRARAPLVLSLPP